MHEHMNVSGETAGRAAPAQPSGDRRHLQISIGGMTCPHCPSAVEKALKNVAGVVAAHVNLADKTAHVDYDSSRARAADLLRAIRSVGYTPGAIRTRIPIENM